MHLYRLIFRLSLSFSALLLLAGCAFSEGLLAVFSGGATHLAAQVDAAQNRWQALGISDYRIVVTAASVWHAQTVTLTVQNRLVTEHSATCVVAPLEVDGTCVILAYDPADFTVEGLFAQARGLIAAANQNDDPLNQLSGLTFAFDPTYHYPARLVSAPPNVYDADRAWIVNEFTPLDDQ